MHIRKVSAAGFRVAAAAVAATGLFLTSCSQSPTSQSRLFRMGERVPVGPLIYNVLDTEWKTQLGDGAEARAAKNRFLLIQLSVTNSGAKESYIPSLTLEDARGTIFREDTGGGSINNWLGLLRKTAPAETIQGRVVFDVPTGAYHLRVSDDADPGHEVSALVDIPLRIEPEPIPPGLKEVPETVPAPKR